MAAPIWLPDWNVKITNNLIRTTKHSCSTYLYLVVLLTTESIRKTEEHPTAVIPAYLIGATND
jgi:hypothetical protein